ncbi:MAG: hypothetical protein PVJ57_02050 [Phycisphaerae bacterium]|jgi:hypothetical protein
MATNGSELRSIAWSEVFPFVRLFSTFRHAIHFYRLGLGLACVACVYFGGRILDGVWRSGGGGVLVAPDGSVNEIQAYVSRNAVDFADWTATAREGQQRRAADIACKLGYAESMDKALGQLTTRPASELTRSDQHEKDVAAALGFVDARLEAGLAKVEADKDMTADQKAKRRADLREAADCVRLVLNGCEPSDLGLQTDATNALRTVSNAAGAELPEDQQSAQEQASKAMSVQVDIGRLNRSRPQGPFISLLRYEGQCFAGAVQGVCTLRWGFSGPTDPRPALVGSIVAAGQGVAWLVTQRPWYAVFYALLHLVVFSFFGGAICRHSVVQAARDVSLSLNEPLRFAREKCAGLLAAALFPLLLLLAGAVVLFVVTGLPFIIGWLLSWIPGLGALFYWLGSLWTILVGLFYGLALLGGLALALTFIATVLGLHLTWPTIAAEGSDAFDAISHAGGYITQRAWHVAFYSFVTLLYGAVCFVMVRLIAMTMLKFTHAITDAALSMFGSLSSAETSTVTKLDAIWHMPAWADMTLLPSTGTEPFWGTLWNAPLSWSEGLAAFFIACWIFFVVAAVGGFIVSFFFCGSTQMYLLLRRDSDGIDYDEIFFEETDEDLPFGEQAVEPGPVGGPAADEPPADNS